MMIGRNFERQRKARMQKKGFQMHGGAALLFDSAACQQGRYSSRSKRCTGQMTVQFVAVLPVLIIVAVITVNALLFFGECASFDSLFRDAVRTYACSPAYGQGVSQSQAQVQAALSGSFDKEYLETSVSAEGVAGAYVRFTGTLSFRPTLFGMGLRSSVLGVSLPPLTHSCEMVVDCYKPGMIL